MKTKFYVYGLYGVDGELLYIGKGTSNRCYSHLRGASSNRFVNEYFFSNGQDGCIQTKKFEDSKQCLTNNKPPQIGVYYRSFSLGDTLHESYTVELCQENDIGWVKFKYYGLSSKDILDGYEMIEKSLIESWEASWRDK